MFSDLHLEIAEAQSQGSHVMLMGDFNAHLDHEPDILSEQHSYLTEYFPQLKQTRMNQKSIIRTNMAGRCLLDISATISLIITTGRGKGDVGQPTYFGYNTIAGNAPTQCTHPNSNRTYGHDPYPIRTLPRYWSRRRLIYYLLTL